VLLLAFAASSVSSEAFGFRPLKSLEYSESARGGKRLD
jgi:hypothetical protein